MPPRTPPGLIDPELLPESDPVASAALAVHMSDTSSVHGIADPAQLALLTDLIRRSPRSFAIDAPSIKTYPGWIVSLAAGQTSAIKKVRYVTDAGDVIFSLRKDGSAIPTWTELTATASVLETTGDESLEENDLLDLSVTSVAGASRLIVTVTVEDS